MQHKQLILEIIEKYTEYGACLGGSRMLQLRGIKVDRESHDIDIIVRQQIPLDNIKKEDLNVYDDSVVSVYMSGIKVDFLLEKEHYTTESINEIPCIDLQSLINAKKRYNTEKHKNDLELILKTINAMDAQKIKELAEKVEATEKELKSAYVMENVKIGRADIRLDKVVGNDTTTSGRLLYHCERIILENSAMIIEEAKLRMNKQLIEQTEELKRATLEYATGFKVN